MCQITLFIFLKTSIKIILPIKDERSCKISGVLPSDDTLTLNFEKQIPATLTDLFYVSNVKDVIQIILCRLTWNLKKRQTTITE